MNKISEKKELILQKALGFVSLYGLEALTIGKLAQEMEMSKSGLFGNFKSKENLQIAVLDFAQQKYIQNVITPTITAPKGVARILCFAEKTFAWTTTALEGSCPFFAAIMEYDDRPGLIREHIKGILEKQHQFLRTMIQKAQETGELKADLSTTQLAYEFYSLLLGNQYMHKMLQVAESKTLQEKAIQNFITHYSN